MHIMKMLTSLIMVTLHVHGRKRSQLRSTTNTFAVITREWKAVINISQATMDYIIKQINRWNLEFWFTFRCLYKAIRFKHMYATFPKIPIALGNK